MFFLAIHQHKKGTNVLIQKPNIYISLCVCVDVRFFESQSFLNTPLQVENVCENSFENENNGTSSIKKPSLINFGLPLLDSGTSNLEVGLPNPMHTYRLKIGIDHDTRTRKDKLYGLVYSRNKQTQSKDDITTLQGQKSNPSPDQNATDSSSPSIPHEISCSLNSDGPKPIDLPISLRKDIRNCTKHSIFDHMSCKNLSPSFSIFISQLSSVDVPKNI